MHKSTLCQPQMLLAVTKTSTQRPSHLWPTSLNTNVFALSMKLSLCSVQHANAKKFGAQFAKLTSERKAFWMRQTSSCYLVPAQLKFTIYLDSRPQPKFLKYLILVATRNWMKMSKFSFFQLFVQKCNFLPMSAVRFTSTNFIRIWWKKLDFWKIRL